MRTLPPLWGINAVASLSSDYWLWISSPSIFILVFCFGLSVPRILSLTITTPTDECCLNFQSSLTLLYKMPTSQEHCKDWVNCICKTLCELTAIILSWPKCSFRYKPKWNFWPPPNMFFEISLSLSLCGNIEILILLYQHTLCYVAKKFVWFAGVYTVLLFISEGREWTCSFSDRKLVGNLAPYNVKNTHF